MTMKNFNVRVNRFYLALSIGCVLSTGLDSTAVGQDLNLDKIAHAVGTYGLTHATQAVCNRLTEGEHKCACLIAGVGVATAVAVGKEVYDLKRGSNTPSTSIKDGVADAVGIGAAVTFIMVDF
jgi:hypothetical protein